jgi:mannosylglycerate hydrolase
VRTAAGSIAAAGSSTAAASFPIPPDPPSTGGLPLRSLSPPDPPSLTIVVGDRPDPPDLDVDALRAEVQAAAEADPDRTWWFQVEGPPRRRLLVDVPVPPLGWTTVRPRQAAAPEPDGPVRADGHRLDNGLVVVEAASDGTLRITGGTVELAGAARLVDGGDAGDLYNYAPPATDELVDAPARTDLRLLETGPLRARLEVARTYRWPAGLGADGTSRAAERVLAGTTLLVEVRAGEPFVRLTLTVENPATDHRVRLHVPVGDGPAARSAAEGQFAVVERGRTAEGGHGEVPLPTYPAHGFVAAGAAALLLDQVSEYELLDGELAVTVLRAVGQISRNNNPWRTEPAGPELPTPGAQCVGRSQFRLAVMPLTGPWHQAGVLDAMERYQHDLVAAPGRGPAGAEVASAAGLEVAGDGVVMSSLRRRDGWFELRLAAEHPDATVATVTGPFDAARRADLLGRPGDDLPVAGRTLRLDLAPWEIATVQLRPDPAG